MAPGCILQTLVLALQQLHLISRMSRLEIEDDNVFLYKLLRRQSIIQFLRGIEQYYQISFSLPRSYYVNQKHLYLPSQLLLTCFYFRQDVDTPWYAILNFDFPQQVRPTRECPGLLRREQVSQGWNCLNQCYIPRLILHMKQVE